MCFLNITRIEDVLSTRAIYAFKYRYIARTTISPPPPPYRPRSSNEQVPSPVLDMSSTDFDVEGKLETLYKILSPESLLLGSGLEQLASAQGSTTRETRTSSQLQLVFSFKLISGGSWRSNSNTSRFRTDRGPFIGPSKIQFYCI